MSTWIEHFTDTISQYFDTPRVLIEALGYWAVGAALGRRVYMEGGVPMFPNMFLIIVSPPGWFRKSTASKKALSIVRRIVGDQGILPNQASSEAFLESIENQDTGVLHFDEFRGYMQHMSKEYASQIHTWLMEMFETSGNHYKLKRAGKEAKSIYSNCLVSFLSTSTTAWLTSSMGKIEALSGFLSRLIIIEAHSKEKELIHQPPFDSSILDDLAEDLFNAIDGLSGAMAFDSKSSMDLYSDCYREILTYGAKVDNPDFPSMIARAPDYLKKVAMIQAAINGRMGVSEDDVLVAARKIIRPSITSLAEIVEEGAFANPFHKEEIRLRKVMKSLGGSAPRRDVLRAMHIRVREFDDIVETMKQQGSISEEKRGRGVILSLSEDTSIAQDS